VLEITTIKVTMIFYCSYVVSIISQGAQPPNLLAIPSEALWPEEGSKGSAEEIKDAAKALQLAVAGPRRWVVVISMVKKCEKKTSKNRCRRFILFISTYGVISTY